MKDHENRDAPRRVDEDAASPARLPAAPELIVVGYEDRLVADHQALLEAARAEGFRAELVDPSRITVSVGGDATAVLVDGVARTPAVALPRGVNRPWPFVRQVLDVWAGFGTRVVPDVAAADLCADKLATARVLAEHGVGVLPTLGVLPGAGVTIDGAPAHPGDDPVLVTKPARASKGEGVRAGSPVETRVDLRRRFPLADGVVDHQIVQPRASDWGVDHRVVVAGGEVVAMTRRHGAPGALTTNTRGATVVDVDDPWSEAPEVAAVAVAACGALGLEFGGIDVIVHQGRAVVLEANAWPGLAAHVRGTTIARALVRRAARVTEPRVALG
ncbi:MAG: RimK family alpha-L-glutamate ligase [Actinomycetota bacterium]